MSQQPMKRYKVDALYADADTWTRQKVDGYPYRVYLAADVEAVEAQTSSMKKMLALCAQWLPKESALRVAAFRVALENGDATNELSKLP